MKITESYLFRDLSRLVADVVLEDTERYKPNKEMETYLARERSKFIAKFVLEEYLEDKRGYL